MINQCQWCLKDCTSYMVISNATLDGSHMDVCMECGPKVLKETPGSKVEATMEHIFDVLNIPGWFRAYFGLDTEGNLTPYDHMDAANSLRREQWFLSGNAYIYQVRETPASEWSPVYISDCGPEVEIDPYDLKGLSELAYLYWGELIDSDDLDFQVDIHPSLKRLNV